MYLLVYMYTSIHICIYTTYVYILGAGEVREGEREREINFF